MIIVPLVALVLTYSYGNDLSVEENVRNLVREIRGLLGI